MARARKGGDPAAKRFQATLQSLKRLPASNEPAAPAEVPAAVEADAPKVEQAKKIKAKTKFR